MLTLRDSWRWRFRINFLFQMDLFVDEMTQTAFAPDGLTSSHPVFLPVRTLDEIFELFDTITYRKVHYDVISMASWVYVILFKKVLNNNLTRHTLDLYL